MLPQQSEPHSAHEQVCHIADELQGRVRGLLTAMTAAAVGEGREVNVQQQIQRSALQVIHILHSTGCKSRSAKMCKGTGRDSTCMSQHTAQPVQWQPGASGVDGEQTALVEHSRDQQSC